jgi:hypothetical protein
MKRPHLTPTNTEPGPVSRKQIKMNTKSILKAAGLAAFFAVATHAHAQVATDSLILHMPMDGNAADISGNGNNGSVTNLVADFDRTGSPNSAFRFNGTDSYIEIPASPSMNKIQTIDEITITAWINIHQWYDNWNVFPILERYNPITDAGWSFEANWATGGILFLADEANPSNSAGCAFTWNFDQWYHVGLTYSQSQGVAKFYVDGVNVCSTPYTANTANADTTAVFHIGSSLAGPNEYSDGRMDDFKIYYRVLDSAEIDTSFTAGLKEHSRNELAVYPNPAKGDVTIGNLPLGSIISIADIGGRVIYRSTSNDRQTTITTGKFANGVYIIQVEGYGVTMNRKLIVDH